MGFFYWVIKKGNKVSAKLVKLNTIVSSAVSALDYELVGCEFISQGRHSVLRIYIDSKDGINVDDCAKVSRQVSAVLDVEEPISSRYTLEVSSPGIERPLFTLEQCEEFIGNEVDVKLRTPLDGRRNFKGSLDKIEQECLIVVVDDEAFTLPFSEIEKANLTGN